MFFLTNDRTLEHRLEMFYSSVVILRSRPTGRKESNRTSSSELQWFCAASLVSFTSEELKSTITYWPILPYSICMAASIAYQTLRNSLLPYNRKRTYALFHRSCEVLDEHGKTFLSARAFATLATDTMQEVDRVTLERNQLARPVDSARDNVVEGSEGPDREPNEAGHSSAHADMGPAENATTQPKSSVEGRPCTVDLTSFQDSEGEAGISNDFDPMLTLDESTPSFQLILT